MSLYFDAAKILSAETREGSLKSRIYGDPDLKSKPDQVYALIIQTSKYDHFLTEVIDRSGLLAQEPKLTPLLSIFLVHDHFFSKKGIAAPQKHYLRQAVDRHKARLQSEFSRARLRRKCPTVDLLRKVLESEKHEQQSHQRRKLRWVRVNTLKNQLKDQLESTFNGYQIAKSLSEIENLSTSETLVYYDKTVPDLLAIPASVNLVRTSAYEDCSIILQDKASCFPAYLLLGNEVDRDIKLGDIIDACAAPGNKTTHLAALLNHQHSGKLSAKTSRIFACEKDPNRLDVLKRTVARAGADTIVSILPSQDFLILNPLDSRFANVTHLLLDPSCSGSGIMHREDIPALALPEIVSKGLQKTENSSGMNSKKRKRGLIESPGLVNGPSDLDSFEVLEEDKISVLNKDRLLKLSNLQARLLEHAFTFPAATHITYSTCSVHFEENEAVVARVLASSVAKDRGWKILVRAHQVTGMKNWEHRGIEMQPNEPRHSNGHTSSGNESPALTDKQRDACIRCIPGGAEGTMGFFVCGFVRQAREEITEESLPSGLEESWEGFSDEDEEAMKKQ